MSQERWRVVTLCVFRRADVNVAFQQAAHKVLLDDDNLLPLLHLTVDYQGKDGKGEQPSVARVFRTQLHKTDTLLHEVSGAT